MSIFASDVTNELPVPGAPGQTITIRKLVKGQLKKAAKASHKQAMAEYFEIADADRERIQKLNEKTPDADAKAAPVNPILLYDAVTLMSESVTSWTLPKPCASESFADLDDDTSDWLAEQILRLSKPSLFEDAETARKNA